MTRLIAIFAALFLITACAMPVQDPRILAEPAPVEAELAAPPHDCAVPGVGPEDGIGGTGCPVD